MIYKYLHLTDVKNIKSIATNGLMPTRIALDHHYEAFGQDGLEQREVNYLWSADSPMSNEQIAKDMVYCKLFIHPRNKQYDVWDKHLDRLWDQNRDGEAEDFDTSMEKYGRKLYGANDRYALLEIDIEWGDVEIYGDYYHMQEPGSEGGSTEFMDDKYAHDSKLIAVTPEIIKPKNMRIVEEISTRIYNNNDIGFTFSRVKPSKYV